MTGASKIRLLVTYALCLGLPSGWAVPPRGSPGSGAFPGEPRQTVVVHPQRSLLPTGTSSVLAQANPWGAGLSTPPGDPLDGIGILPVAIPVSGRDRFQFSAGGLIFSPAVGATAGPDGFQNAPGDEFNLLAQGGISAYKAPKQLALVGVFLGSGGNTGIPPAAIDFSALGLGFTQLSPQLGQVFYIGDGWTGTSAGSGTQQNFIVPAGATTLYLGIAEGCDNFVTASCYTGNAGSFSVSYSETCGSSITCPAGTTSRGSSIACPFPPDGCDYETCCQTTCGLSNWQCPAFTHNNPGT
eukprot:RCo027287